MEKEKYYLYKGAWLFAGECHEEIKLSEEEIGKLMERGGIMLRNIYDFDCKEQTSFWYVLKDEFGGMEELTSRVRNKIRRSQKLLDVKKIDKEEMLSKAYEIHKKACANYKIKTHIPTKGEFDKRILLNDENYEYWACYLKDTDQMISFSINKWRGDVVSYQTFKADPEYLKGGYYPFYGLLYEMNQYYLLEKKVHYVLDGARTITEHSNIQPFLIEQLKFRKAYCHFQIKYVWWMKILVTLLFPFRKFIPINSIKAILNMEAMRRNLI